MLPSLAAGIGALLKREQRKFAAGIAIASMSLSFVLAMVAFVHLLGAAGSGYSSISPGCNSDRNG